MRSLLFKIEVVVIPPKDELNADILNLCSTFKTRHIQQCKEDVLADRRSVVASFLYMLHEPLGFKNGLAHFDCTVKPVLVTSCILRPDTTLSCPNSAL